MKAKEPEITIHRTDTRVTGSVERDKENSRHAANAKNISGGQKSLTVKSRRISVATVLAVAAFFLGIVRIVAGEPKDAALCLAISLICIMRAANKIPVCSQSVVTVANNMAL